MTNFYDVNATNFFDATINVDMSPIYEKFLHLVPKNGHILDAGCGSGRDTLHFLNQGYNATAFDASNGLCELATVHIGQEVQCLRFNEITWQNLFDAAWACASLLHLTEEQLPEAVQRIITSIKVGGVIYCSFKWGDKERYKDDRHFTDMNQERFNALIAQTEHAEVIDFWITEDSRPDRKNEKWLNAILRKNYDGTPCERQHC